MKNVKMTMKQLRTCLMLCALAVFVYIYLIVYADYTEKTAAVKDEVAYVDRQIETRQELLSGSENLEERMKALQEQTDEIIEQYPSRLTIPDTLLFLQEFNNENKLEIISISVGDQSTFYDTTVPKRQSANGQEETMVAYNKDEEETSQETTTETETQAEGDVGTQEESASTEYMQGVRCSINLSFQGSYQAVKDCMKYLNEYPKRITMDSISMAYDTTTGLVNGSMSLSMYAIEGNGVEYSAPILDDISIGKNVIFDTMN